MINRSQDEPIDSVSVVIPVYNSEQGLTQLVNQIFEHLGSIRDLELILIDDRSGDESWTEIKRLAKLHPEILGLRLLKNYGQHNATLAGVRAATKDFIFTLDDDLQFSPANFRELKTKLIDSRSDLVYGRAIEVRAKLHRRILSGFSKKFVFKLIGALPNAKPSPMRLFKTSLRNGFSNYTGPNVSLDSLLLWSTNNAASVDVPHYSRVFGNSNYSFKRLVRHAIDVVVSFGVAPLRLVSLFGFSVSVFSFVFLVVIVSNAWISVQNVPGFPTLAATISLFAGVQLLALGVLSEYLAQMHFRVMGKPPYSIDEFTKVTEGYL
jgi:undecaprenyl-phosphate 4-deoxy-4-formamido-L-arabinose transferase